jgi:hypothetical protein
MLQTVVTIKRQLLHIAISSYSYRSITAHCDQFWQLKVNYSLLQSVLTIKSQLQHIVISTDN